MKTGYVFLLLLIITVSFGFTINNKSAFKQLTIINGSWIMHMKNAVIIESWQKKSSNEMTGKSIMIRNERDTMLLETISLVSNKQSIVFTALTGGYSKEQATSFVLSSAKGNKFVFENPQHDFPKRITYHLINKDSIHAWIDDGLPNPVKKSDFFYSRIK